MGYTHYFKQIEELPKDKWNKFIEEVKTKLDDGQTMLRFEYNSNKPPQIDEETVRFNGLGECGNESFNLSRVIIPRDDYDIPNDKGMYFNCCKTARKPYDYYIVSVLILMEKYFGNDVEITSDGDWDHIKKLDTEEYIEHVLKPETNSTISSLEGLIQNVYDVIGDLQKGKITTEDIPKVYKQFLDGYPHLHNDNEFRR
tara:strand:+ start:120 stop:716 length:597 start_codon:yes stop_codon:yes gene_type:complete